MKRHFSRDEARLGALLVGLPAEIPMSEFAAGLDVELEHADITGGDLYLTGRIALAHLREFPDYYTRLERMERQAKRDWGLK